MEEKYTGYYSMGLAGYEVGVSDNGETAFYRYAAPIEDCSMIRDQHAKIRFTNAGRAYFLANGRRIHLDECLRKKF